jgi:uncharacterized protein (DUF58 family)
MESAEGRVATLFSVPLILIGVGIFLFLALLYGERDLTVWGILVLAVIGGAKLWGRVGLAGVSFVSSTDKKRVFPEERFIVQIGAENAKFLPVWLQITVPAEDSILPFSGETALVQESSLWWRQRADFRWELKARRRGVHPVGPSRITVADLLGFFPKERERTPLHIIVYPRIIPLVSFSLPRRDFFGVPGKRSPVKDPIYILGTRDYQHWQPAKYIHWKASARHSRLQEKVFDPSEQEKVLLVLDVTLFSRSGEAQAFERMLEIIASLAVQFDRKGYAIGLTTNGKIRGGKSALVPLARNPQQLAAILEVLARLRMEPEQGVIATLARGVSLPWGISCICCSLEADESALAIEEHFVSRRIPTIFVVSRPPAPASACRERFRSTIYNSEQLTPGASHDTK